MTMSRPLRLVPQAAQPIEFCCPLCNGVHAAYIFGTGQFRVFRCGGCALTFTRKTARGSEPAAFAPTDGIGTTNRGERDHASLLAAINAEDIKGPILIVARREDSLVELLQHRGITIGA